MKKLAATLLGASLILMAGAAAAGPMMEKSISDLRTQARQNATQPPCLPANGAQIMAGFAGQGDSINAATGQVCGQR